MEPTLNLKTQAYTQVAEIELVYKSKVKNTERPSVCSSSDAYEIFKNCWDDNKLELSEQFKVMLLNRNNRVLGICQISSGGVTGTVVDMKHVFALAIKANACSIIIAHNHPSGNTRPSESDEKLTAQIHRAGDILDVKLFDHLIITSESYFSFTDEGLL